MRVLLGVTGGIAAYKAAELVGVLGRAGHEVRVAMTPAATHFVGPLTFEALTGHPVLLDVLSGGSRGGDSGTAGPGAPSTSAVEHVAWAKWAEIALIAPLTASTLGKLACGIADNALVTIWLALPPSVPVLLCPAMNTQMWEHPVVQRNLRWLVETGRYTVVPPVEKRLACGDVGLGGLAEPETIAASVEAAAESLRRSGDRGR